MIGGDRTNLTDRDKTTFDANSLLGLGAAPTFAVMAALTAASGGGMGSMSSMGADASPLDGMISMYVLMSVFHSGPWLKLMRAVGSRWALRRQEQSTLG